MSKNDRHEVMRSLSLISQMGVTIAACVAIGVFLGKTLDNFFGCSPFLLIVFSLLGAAAAFKVIFTLTIGK